MTLIVNRTIQERKGVAKVSEVRREDLQLDEIDQLIADYKGDIKTIIAGLLNERQMLIRQIEIAACAMSFGYGRGWKPKIPQK